MIFALLLGIAGVLVILIELLDYRRKRKDLPPGPFQWPVIGNSLLLSHLTRKHQNQALAFLELSRQYSSNVLYLRFGGCDVIVVSGYKEIQHVFRSEEFDGRPWNEYIKIRNMGLRKGITMTDGSEWKQIRAWVVRSLRELGFGRTSYHIKNELQLTIDSLKKNGTIVRMKSILAPATYNMLWEIATGKAFAEDDMTIYNNFISLMDRRSEEFDIAGGNLAAFPWLRYVAPEKSGYNILATLNSKLDKMLMELIQAHKKNYLTNENKDNLIDKFLKEMDERGGNDPVFDSEQLFVILLDLFIAGSVNTHTTLDFLFLRMTVHQEVQRRVQQELDSVIGWNRLPDLSDRAKLPYTEAVLTEFQRIQMIAPILGPRRVLRECSINGYRIPKNYCLLINLASIYMNPEYYPNPESFNPERFFINGAYVPDEKLKFFGQGHRRCPGEAEAKGIIFLFFVGIMQHFQLLPAPGQEIPNVEQQFGLMNSSTPYKVRLVPRQRNV